MGIFDNVGIVLDALMTDWLIVPFYTFLYKFMQSVMIQNVIRQSILILERF